MERPAFLVLAEGGFGPEASKTAVGAIRYLPERVSAVLSAEHAGRTVEEVLGFGGAIPVVASLEEALRLSPPPEALLIGIAPQGGTLPDDWRPVLEAALDAGLELWSGLHEFLEEDPELGPRARELGVRIRDLRRPPRDLPVAAGRAMETDALRVLTVGTDCNVGKMTAALELRRELSARGIGTAFAATGQTGILIEGRGIAVDAVPADFVAGSAERLVLEAAGRLASGASGRPAATASGRPRSGVGSGPGVVLVEGQGSLLHPGYSGVTLGLLHGAVPQAMVLCDRPSRKTIYGGRYDWLEVPPLDEVVALYEEAARWIRPREPCRVVGICRATFDLSEAEARRSVEEARERTGLAATDPVRFGAGELADTIARVAAS